MYRFRDLFPATLGALIGAASISSADAADFTLSSRSLKPGSPISPRNVLNGFGCQGENVSPALSWSDPPPGTRSFALTLYDPDAPTGSGWWHWVVFNIPAEATSLPEGASGDWSKSGPPGSIQGMTDFGSSTYGGPCPPKGDRPHNYILTLHALSTEALPLDNKAPAAMVGYFVGQATIAKAKISIPFGR